MTDKRLCTVSTTLWPKVEVPSITLAFSYADGIFGVLSRERGKLARIRVDKNPVIETRSCGPAACEVDLAGSVELADQISRGQKILVEFTTWRDVVVGPYEFNAEGFVAAFKQGKAMASE